MRRVGTRRLVWLLVVAAACGDDPVSPAGPAGQYTLTHAAGQPVPAVVFEGTVPGGTEPDFHLRVVASSGSLVLTDDGRYDHEVDLSAFVDGAPQPATHWSDHGLYTVDGDSLHFDSDFIEKVRFSGSFAGGQVEVEQDLPGEGEPVPYRFVRD